MPKTAYFQYSKFRKGHNSYKKLTQSNGSRTWSAVQSNRIIYKISALYVKECRRKMRKTSVTDGRTDGQTDRLTECKPIVPPGFTGGTFSVPNAYQSLQKDLVLTDSEMTLFVNFANITISQLSLSVHGGKLKPMIRQLTQHIYIQVHL